MAPRFDFQLSIALAVATAAFPAKSVSGKQQPDPGFEWLCNAMRLSRAMILLRYVDLTKYFFKYEESMRPYNPQSP